LVALRIQERLSKFVQGRGNRDQKLVVGKKMVLSLGGKLDIVRGKIRRDTNYLRLKSLPNESRPESLQEKSRFPVEHLPVSGPKSEP